MSKGRMRGDRRFKAFMVATGLAPSAKEAAAAVTGSLSKGLVA